jgi:prephenate dehydratase
VKKASPFPIEDAAVTFTPGHQGADGSAEFLVVTARRDIVAEYEAVCEELRVYAGLVDLADRLGVDPSDALQRLHRELAVANINMTKLESRPSKAVLGQYIFLVDINGHRQASQISAAP